MAERRKVRSVFEARRSPGTRWRWVPENGHGRRLRALAGVNEELLDQVPEERARYTGLGGVVLGTAVIAGFSMWMALTAVHGGTYLLAVVPVLIWALFVLNLDRWLVSSATGTQGGRRIGVLLARLPIAVLLGVVVAEPLVLRIFETAVEQQVKDSRERKLDSHASRLLACNPVPGDGREPAADCGEFRITLAADPAALATELADRERDSGTLAAKIKADATRLAELHELARRECLGQPGPGLTGVRGVGLECRRLRKEADDFAATHPIGQDERRLADLNGQVSQLRDKATAARDGYRAGLDAEIRQRKEQSRANQGPIGLLERFQALDELIKDNGFLWAATWMIRLFLIMIDCLPVLVKLIGGTTTYDRLLDQRTVSRERIFLEGIRAEEVVKMDELGVRRDRALAKTGQERAEIEWQVRQNEAYATRRMHEDVDRAYEQLLKQGSKPVHGEGASYPRNGADLGQTIPMARI